MKRFISALAAVIVIPAAIYAWWGSWTQLTAPADVIDDEGLQIEWPGYRMQVDEGEYLQGAGRIG